MIPAPHSDHLRLIEAERFNSLKMRDPRYIPSHYAWEGLDRKPSVSSWTAGTDGVAYAHGNGTPSN